MFIEVDEKKKAQNGLYLSILKCHAILQCNASPTLFVLERDFFANNIHAQNVRAIYSSLLPQIP